VLFRSRVELANVRPSLCDEEIDPQARVISATMGELRVYSVYAPNGQAIGSAAYEYKLRWFARLQRCLTSEPIGRLIVCGDFNVAPNNAHVQYPALCRVAIMLPE